MASLDEIKAERLKKLEILKGAGVDPYPSVVSRTSDIKTAVATFETLVTGAKVVTLAGRVMAVRGQGALIFININDGSGYIQGLLKRDEMDEKLFDLFAGTIDVGDFVEVTGTALVTKRGEKTVKITSWVILTKSLLPLPDKWGGLQDEEMRFRKRYLDILMNPEGRTLLELKAKFWEEVRGFLKARNFLEVETPTLELTTGGAEATPFKTHHNDFDLDVFLRISVGELWQKRLLAAGLPRVFEIGRVYRNEGSSPEHLQEFTNIEFYAGFMNFDEGRQMIKDLYRTLAEKVFGRTKFEVKGHSFDLATEWEELDYVTTVKKMTGVDILEATEVEMKAKLDELGVVYEGQNRERLADSLWKHCRKQVSGPAWLLNHPKLVAPLSKEHPDDPRKTLTCQVILAGSEIGRAHAELNDPLDQIKRFNEQQALLEAGDTEAMMPDYDFIEAMEHGIPPAFGFGFGERLFSYLAGQTIRETQAFPLMKPKEEKKTTDN